MSAMRKNFFGLTELILIFSYISLVFLQMDGFARDPGVGWHLANGRNILSTHIVPLVDPFLYAESPRSWVSDQWLSDLIMFQLYDLGGWPALYGILTVVYLLTFFLILAPAVRRFTLSAAVAPFVALLAFKLSQVHFILRPVVFAFFLFSIVTTEVFRIQREAISSPRDLKKSFYILPILFFVWANIHPSFVLGLLLLALLIVGVLYDLVFLRIDIAPGILQRLAVLLVVCLLATLVNPYGVGLHHSIVELAGSSYFMSLHQEWLTPNFKENVGQLLQFVWGTLFVSLLLGRNSKLTWRSFEVFAIIIFSVLATRAVRMVPFFSILIAIPLADAILNLRNAACWSNTLGLSTIRRFFAKVEKYEQRGFNGKLLLPLVITGLLVGSLFFQRVPLFTGVYGPPKSSYPYGVLATLNKLSLDSPVVVLASPDWGGFINFYAPQVKTLLDDRNTLLGEDYFRKFNENFTVGDGWLSYARSLNATHILLPNQSGLGYYIKSSGVLPLISNDEHYMLFGIK